VLKFFLKERHVVSVKSQVSVIKEKVSCLVRFDEVDDLDEQVGQRPGLTEASGEDTKETSRLRAKARESCDRKASWIELASLWVTSNDSGLREIFLPDRGLRTEEHEVMLMFRDLLFEPDPVAGFQVNPQWANAGPVRLRATRVHDAHFLAMSP